MADQGVGVDAFLITRGAKNSGPVRVAVRGELDLAHASELRELLKRELDSGRPVWLDLSEVGFIDSTGLAAIVSALNHSKEAGCELLLAGDLQPQARRLMELTGVLPLLSLVGNNNSD